MPVGCDFDYTTSVIGNSLVVKMRRGLVPLLAMERDWTTTTF
jgi:hypothetical protein